MMFKKLKVHFVLLLFPIVLLPIVVAAGHRRALTEDAQLSSLRQSIEAKLNEMRETAEFPGATVGFVLPDGRSASVSAGFADIENKIGLKPADRMLAGSIGKTFVAAVTLQLVGEGKLSLDKRIQSWLGGEAWFARLPNAPDITVRMLMNHTSGIPEHVLEEKFIAAVRNDPDRIWRPAELISYILDKKPLFPAGQGWSYADTNYIFVGMIVERVTGKTLYSEVERRILKPLRLERTVPSNSRTIPGLISGYSRAGSPFGFEGRTIVGGKFVVNPQFEWTGGGFASTADDLARWASALYQGKAFKRELLDQMLAGVETKQGRGAGPKYGLAVQIRQTEWGASYGHGGWFPGYLSEMQYFPDKKVAIAIQFNTDNARGLKKGLAAYVADFARIVIDGLAQKRAA